MSDNAGDPPTNSADQESNSTGELEKKVVYLEDAPLYAATEHDVKFDPDEYLKGFYVSAKEDEAMSVMLFFLPGILYRLPKEVSTLLDLGAGPTIYVPLAVRNRADNVYTSDYSKTNRERLISFIKGDVTFDWTNICQWIASIESTVDTPERMLQQARRKMRGVLEVNVQCDEVIRSVEYLCDGVASPPPAHYDVVVSIFCLEYSCESLDGYQRAVRGATQLVKPRGFLIYGGIMNATDYGFAGRRFKCHCLKKEEIIDALTVIAEEGTPGFHFIVHDDVFLLISQKSA